MDRLKMMKTCLGIGLLLGIFLLSGCGGDAGGGKWDAPPETNILLVSLAVTPAAASIPIDGFKQYTATATYDDGSTGDVTASSIWTSATPAVATISASGSATGVTAGTSQITAAFGGLTSAAVTLTVTPATLTSLVVTPPLASITVGGTRQYAALATFSDSSTLIVTSAPTTVWSLATPAVATISASGLATGVTAGTTEITATFGGLTSIAVTLTVDPALALTIVPGAVCSVDSGPTIPTVTMSDPTSGNVLATTSTAGVANNGKLITATFNLEMDPATIASGTAPFTFTIVETISGNNVPGTVTLDATNKIATFTTDAALLADTNYTASITTDAMSAGVPSVGIACPYEWDFKTVTPAAIGVGPVNLGSAATFGIAATAGVTNTTTAPITIINGDVVLDPLAGAICNEVAVDGAGGFGLCGSNGSTPILNGTVISPLYSLTGGPTSTQIVADLKAAYISIAPPAGPPAAGSLGGATNLPAGTTLGADTGSALVEEDNLFYPGVYQSLTSILVTGDLTLDAQGNPDAVFVFQSSSTIGTADGVPSPGVHSRILLVGGAKAANVWWQAGTSATLGTYSEFKGNILASESITMKTGASSCGRLLAGAFAAGAFVFDSNVVSVPGNVNDPSCQ